MKTRRFDKPKVLSAGCGTGQQCIAARATYPGARITAIDFSVASLAYAARKCQEAGLSGITFEPGELEAFARHGFKFDLIECTGVLHHLPDLEAGAAALRRLATPGSLLRLWPSTAPRRAGLSGRFDRSLPPRMRTVLCVRSGGCTCTSWRAGRKRFRKRCCGRPTYTAPAGCTICCSMPANTRWGRARGWRCSSAKGFSWICMDPPDAVLQAVMADCGRAAASWSAAQSSAATRPIPW